MAIIVEDGSIVTGANSYVTEAEVTDYATERGITLTATASVLIYKSMDFIESQSFLGVKSTATQPLQWPRYGVYIDGYSVDSDEIPLQLKAAQLAVCVAIDQGYDPLGAVDRSVKREKVDVIEVEYADNSAATSYARTINAALKKLLNGGGGLQVWRG